MSNDPSLKLSFRPEAALPDMHRISRWRGFSVEHSRITGPSDYTFSWTGDSHYLCLHDLLLADGRLVVDGLRPVSRRDLRNNMTYIPKGCGVTGSAAPVDRTNSFTALYFDPETISNETERLYKAADSYAMIYFDDLRLRQTMEKLRGVLLQDGAVDPLYAETLCLLAAIEVAQLHAGDAGTAQGVTGGLSENQLKLVFDFVESRLGSEITLDEMAGVAGLSRFHFARAFKKSVGEPPYAYVLRQRIEHAKRLLTTTKLQVSEVATATGFKTASHFVRAFQQAVGNSPGVFRRM
jgi:AraC family transcriptional regulator